MSRSIVCCVCVLFAAVAATVFSEPPPDGQSIVVKGTVVELYDGDTIVVEIRQQVRVRLIDCWAAEVRTSDAAIKERGIAARDYLREKLPVESDVLLKVPTTGRLQDSISFGRVLGRCWADLDGDGKLDDIADAMVASGHATKTR